MRRVGSGLGAGGFAVFDDSACMVQAAWRYSRFLFVESCGQCPACKFGTGEVT
jgi:NADH-quinone oxidoreductase subunit F